MVFTLKIKSQSIAYLLNGSEHIYWTLDLEDEMHSTWMMYTSGLQQSKGFSFFFFSFLKLDGVYNTFQLGSENFRLILWELPRSARSWGRTQFHLPQKVSRREDIVGLWLVPTLFWLATIYNYASPEDKSRLDVCNGCGNARFTNSRELWDWREIDSPWNELRIYGKGDDWIFLRLIIGSIVRAVLYKNRYISNRL